MKHEWVLCLDDDVLVHPGTLHTLVEGLPQQQGCFMATGRR